jgi:polyhydroxyalkanoate synthesis regulator phasin
MDKRKAWREQEQMLVQRWNAAATRYQDLQARISQQAADGTAAQEELMREAEQARADIDAMRRQVARLKVEFVSGKRY